MVLLCGHWPVSVLMYISKLSHPLHTTTPPPPAPIIHNYFYPPLPLSGTPRDNWANDIIGECSGPGAGRGGGWAPDGINKVTRHQASVRNMTTARIRAGNERRLKLHNHGEGVPISPLLTVG